MGRTSPLALISWKDLKDSRINNLPAGRAWSTSGRYHCHHNTQRYALVDGESRLHCVRGATRTRKHRSVSRSRSLKTEPIVWNIGPLGGQQSLEVHHGALKAFQESIMKLRLARSVNHHQVGSLEQGTNSPLPKLQLLMRKSNAMNPLR